MKNFQVYDVDSYPFKSAATGTCGRVIGYSCADPYYNVKLEITQENLIQMDNDILQAVKTVMEGEVFVPEMYLYVRVKSSSHVARAAPLLRLADQGLSLIHI